jgi:hypothetical protein
MPNRNGAPVVSYEYIKVETEGHLIFVLTINRPELMNAISRRCFSGNFLAEHLTVKPVRTVRNFSLAPAVEAWAASVSFCFGAMAPTARFSRSPLQAGSRKADSEVTFRALACRFS